MISVDHYKKTVITIQQLFLTEFKKEDDKANLDRVGRWIRLSTAELLFERTKQILIFKDAIEQKNLKFFEEFKFNINPNNKDSVSALSIFKQFIAKFPTLPENKQKIYWGHAQNLIDIIQQIQAEKPS